MPRCLHEAKRVARLQRVGRYRKKPQRFGHYVGKNRCRDITAVIEIPFRLVNNNDWFQNVRFVTFLRDIGKHFSVNTMLSRESVRARLEDRDHGISFTEFSYTLLQAYDFLQLYDEHHCRLQTGGSDQWGNIVAGMDLTRRLRPEASTFGLTLPLVTKSDGTKFGKTESGNVWLDPEKTSPYAFYQFWINSADADVVNYLKYFTFLSQDEISTLTKAVEDAPHERAAQKKLANEVTQMVHGETALSEAIGASKAMFGGELSGLSESVLEDVFSEVPSSELPKSDLHCHLDGSLRPESLIEMARERGVKLPSESPAGLFETVFKERYTSLEDYLQGFAYTCAVLRDAEALERAAYELCLDNQEEGVRYLEIRFAPQLSTHEDFGIGAVLGMRHEILWKICHLFFLRIILILKL